MKQTLVASLLLFLVASWSCGAKADYLTEDFEGMIAGDPITDYPGWTSGAAGYASGSIIAGNYLQTSGTYPSGSGNWDWVKLDISGLPLAGNKLNFSADVGNNLVAGQYYGRRVRWGIVDANGSYLARVEMLDFNTRLTFNGVHFDGLLSSSLRNYVFDLDFNAQTVTLSRDGTFIGTEALLGGNRTVSDVQGLIFETGANFPKVGRWVKLDIDNIVLVPEPATLSLLALGSGLALWRRRK